MSATVKYQPLKGFPLSLGAPSSFMEALRRAFGNEPWTLTGHDYYLLMGLVAGLESTEERRAAEELAEAVMKYNEVRVWAEY